MQQKLLTLIAKIPEGKVTTYGDLGKILNVSPRYIGRLLHTNPDPGIYPCHRVVRSDGGLATGYAFGGQNEQLRKLKAEGIEFGAGRIVDFKIRRYIFR